MAVTLSSPHFKPTPDGANINEFTNQLKSFLNLKSLPYYSVEGNSMKGMLDLSSSEARGTSYNKELAAGLDVSSLHIELRAYDFNTNEDWSEADFVLGELSGYTNDEILNRFENTITKFGKVEVVDILPLGHYSTALSELVYEVPSIVLYVNADSMELYSSVAEGITDIISYYEENKTS
jgi:hypothetical protein